MPWTIVRHIRPSLGRVVTPMKRLEANHNTRCFHLSTTYYDDVVPLRKQLKDAAKETRKARGSALSEKPSKTSVPPGWELTVGIEIHAQLNAATKLFSNASTDYSEEPNRNVKPFDIALPGSQPILQRAVLLPALRAALALNCKVQTVSTFDRKHYFYHDQPAGYQLTQYYNPLARDGFLTLTTEEGLAASDGPELHVGIKQIQLEQDTARTHEQDAETNLIDFNRSGHPLIEIISLPHIHSPEAAATYVKKVQSILYAVDAATTGMELGGLRADVNVSVKKISQGEDENRNGMSYGGVRGLGQRTEIKNLSSFRAVEDAVKAEMSRQIQLLEEGGVVEGETRGWSLTSPNVTRRLRGKEGEVDYRYMPDPDIAPLRLDPELIKHVKRNIPPVPERLLAMLREQYLLSAEDAKAMLSLDSGERLVYYQDIVARLLGKVQREDVPILAANWVLHELGSLLTTHEVSWTPETVSAPQMSDLLTMLVQNQITGPSAKKILKIVFDGDTSSTADIVDREGLRFVAMSDQEYQALAAQVIEAHPTEAEKVRQGDRQSQGKLKFLLGQMMRQGERGRMEATRAETMLQSMLTN